MVGQWVVVVVALVLLVGLGGYVLGSVRSVRGRDYFYERVVVDVPESVSVVEPPVVNVYVVAPQLGQLGPPVYSPSLRVDAGVVRGLPCGEWVVMNVPALCDGGSRL